jgi:5-methylcytosine-specific restriction protein B
MTKTEIRYFLDKISKENILNAFQVLDENEKSTQSMIRQYVVRNEGKTYPPPETLRIAYENATGEKLPEAFFANIGEGSEQFKFIRENKFELNLKDGRNKFYLKRLLENELGYRNGTPTTGETFMVSKEAGWHFFPPLGITVKNDHRKLLISSKISGEFHSVTYTYHNDKFFGGSRNEFRIYLTSDLLSDFTRLVPNDLVLISMVHESDNKYEMLHIKKGDNEFKFFDDLLGKENHYLTDNFKDSKAENIIKSTNKYPLNQILYGPPGTGKTYSTITKALNIIGLLEEKDSYSKEEYEKAQNLFQNELGKRIEFVTMHQSFSYEDFVQGLKPRKSDDGNGISFDYKNGVFKEICCRAEESSLLIKRSSAEDTVLIDKLFPSFYLSIDEQSVYEILKVEKFDGKKVTQKDAIEFINEKLGKKYCKAWRDKFDYVLGDKSPRVGYQADKFRDGELEEFIEYAKFFGELTPEKRKEKLIREWIQDIPNENIQENQFSNHVIILDEINRANISRVFGELIALIEKDKRDGKLTATLPSGEAFTIPSNLYIIGTMNTADKSIALVDIALRRRFKFIPLYPDLVKLKMVLGENGMSDDDMGLRIAMFENINRIIRSKKSVDFEIGHSYFMEKDTLINILNHQILPLMNEYFMYDLRKVKEIIEQSQKDREGNIIPKLGIQLNQTLWKERGLLEVEKISSPTQEAIVDASVDIDTDENDN